MDPNVIHGGELSSVPNISLGESLINNLQERDNKIAQVFYHVDKLQCHID